MRFPMSAPLKLVCGFMAAIGSFGVAQAYSNRLFSSDPFRWVVEALIFFTLGAIGLVFFAVGNRGMAVRFSEAHPALK